MLEYSRNNFSEGANVFVALSSSHRVPEPMDACNKFVLVVWLDKAMQKCFQFEPEKLYVFGFQMNVGF